MASGCSASRRARWACLYLYVCVLQLIRFLLVRAVDSGARVISAHRLRLWTWTSARYSMLDPTPHARNGSPPGTEIPFVRPAPAFMPSIPIPSRSISTQDPRALQYML
ncbi:hypothetical protein C8R44DRAFT_992213 [Mycena epipterygia]|nr:hypothetical protein C8R44DRAFT_992213 [Mycena epipterygia]